MHGKSRKYNCIRYVEKKYGSLLEERVSKEKTSCEGKDKEFANKNWEEKNAPLAQSLLGCMSPMQFNIIISIK